jgi:hypothetical protein
MLALGFVVWTAPPTRAQEPSGAATREGASAPSGDVATALATLVPLTDESVSGEASALQAGATTTVVVRLRGLAPGTAHAGHIHQGSCGGPILFPLGTVVADSLGRGSAGAEVPAPLDTAGWWVQYHAAGGPPGPGIACGPVVAGAALPLDETERCPIRGPAAAALCVEAPR